MDMNAAYIVPGGRPPPGGAGNDRAMGAILVDAGRLTPEDAEIILRNQRDEGLRFGDAALRLGLLSEEDIQFALSRQFDYPYLAPGDLSVSKELVAAFSPFTPLVEQLRALRSQLMLRWFDGEPGSSSARRILPILSPGHGEGRSFIAANLAVVFSQLGERTLLIDADLRSPHQADIFHLENRVGLSSILAGRAGLADAVVRIGALVDLSVLPSGPIPPNPQELLSRPQFNSLLNDVACNFDVILLDTPAAALYADASALAGRAGGAVLVARKGMTLAADLAGLGRSLQQAGIAVVGTVLNDD
ncbi:putative polysaccharide export protein [Oryzomicrobium terrae]|uniref:Putative polysaccharide export protein n=1 Tax=Oryzomicrobium terrae TaxID=1735038 RepID=A0A5C1E8V7_9RHOO|nr:chain length determinant protein tyrosine kinase EpsG [Oryzomicrobium terrae]QEL65392.1 putative polysaccharide export protein [Oryzomicrobium terrae]